MPVNDLFPCTLNGLPVGNLGCLEINFNAKFSLQFIPGIFQMNLACAGKDNLRGGLIPVHPQGGVFLY